MSNRSGDTCKASLHSGASPFILSLHCLGSPQGIEPRVFGRSSRCFTIKLKRTLIGELGRIRTCDALLFRQTLYQLSYESKIFLKPNPGNRTPTLRTDRPVFYPLNYIRHYLADPVGIEPTTPYFSSKRSTN